MEDRFRASHTYQQTGPFVRARVRVYGRTPDEAVEAGRDAVQRFAAELPRGVNCWAARYEGFDEKAERHAATFVVGFATSEQDSVREQVDRLVQAL